MNVKGVESNTIGESEGLEVHRLRQNRKPGDEFLMEECLLKYNGRWI